MVKGSVVLEEMNRVVTSRSTSYDGLDKVLSGNICAELDSVSLHSATRDLVRDRNSHGADTMFEKGVALATCLYRYLTA